MKRFAPAIRNSYRQEKIRARHGRRRDEFCAINTGA
jgi:hypothetical protein